MTVIVIAGERRLANGPSISKHTGSEDFETHIGLWIVGGFLTVRIGQCRKSIIIFLSRF